MNCNIENFVLKLASNNTQTAYRTDLSQLTEYLSRLGTNLSQLNVPILEATTEHLCGYRNQLISKKLSPATINRKFSAIRNFYKWAVLKNLVVRNIADQVELPRWVNLTSTQALMDDEARSIVKLPNVRTKRGRKHRLVLTLLLQLGLRRSELVSLKYKDIYQDGQHTALRIVGKGGKIRRLPLSPEVVKELEFFRNKLKKDVSPEDFVVKMAPSSIRRIVRRYSDELGISADRHIGAHSCRATVVSHLLDTKKVPIRDVADFAGHSSVLTTQLYDKKRNGMADSAALLVGY